MSLHRKAPGRGDGARAWKTLYQRGDSNSGKNNSRLPRDWRDRLPDPVGYFRGAVESLSKPNASGFAQCKCPFHEDKNASLSVKLSDPRGGWKCFAGCGRGDLVAFHMRRTGLPFVEAVRDLIGAAQ